MNTSSNINKILLIIGVFLLVLIISLILFYFKEKRNNEENLERIIKNNYEEETSEVEKQVIGNDFDFAYINDAKLLDEVDDIRFMFMDEKYYLLRGDELISCSYKNDKYRYCYIDDYYKIDFSEMKIIKSDD